MMTIFSLVYMLFGIMSWLRGDAEARDIVTCFVLGSIHCIAGSWLLVSSLRDYRDEKRRIEDAVRHIAALRGGRVTVAELADIAELSQDDAREYLERRTHVDVVVRTPGKQGEEHYVFGGDYWKN
jgi:hypothetical protein